MDTKFFHCLAFDFSELDFLCFEHYFDEKLIKGCEDKKYEDKDNYYRRKIQLRQDNVS